MENENEAITPPEKPKQVSTMMEEPTWDPETETLTITFKKGGTYAYANFPPEKFVEFHAAQSWGKWFHSNRPLFANGVPAQQVSRAEEVPALS